MTASGQPAPGPLPGNLDAALAGAWHPVAAARELRHGGWLQVRLLGRTWTLHRTADGPVTEPPAAQVRERLGLLWLAAADPVGEELDAPEVADRRFVGGWLPPVRFPGPAASLTEALLATAQGTFGHGGRAGTPLVDVVDEPGGFSAVLEHETPAGPCARRPERRRLVVGYRAPFQLRLRHELPVSGVVSAALFLLQPEDADSTRVHTRVLLSAGPGRPLPAPSEVVAEMADVHRSLERDVQDTPWTAGTGPVPQEGPADRLGEALRRALADLGAGHRRVAAV